MIQTTRRRWIAGTPGASIASEEVTPSLQGQLSTAYAPCRVGVPHITHDRPIDASGCEAILRCNQDARQFPPEAVVAMQAVSGTLHLALHTLRRNRENRNPDAAARGFHNLNLEQWEALSEDERHHNRSEQQHYSDLVTRLALAGILSNIAIGAAGKASGRPELAARLLAGELKIAPYAAARDAIQATLRMVGMRAPTNGGVSDPHVTSAGRFYRMANVLTNLASNELELPDFASARQRWAGLMSPFNMGEATNVVFRYGDSRLAPCHPARGRRSRYAADLGTNLEGQARGL